MIYYFLIYFIGAISFYLWDAFIGWGGFEWDGKVLPPPIVAGLLWFVAIPLAALILIVKFLSNIRDHRLQRAEETRQIRIKTQRDLKEAQEEVDFEFDSLQRNKYL